MNILQMTKVKSEAELRTLFTKIGLQVSSEGKLNIVKYTDKTDLEAASDIEKSTFQLKGLIYDSSTGLVVAPGVIVPSNIVQINDLASLEDKVAYITPAQDGVMFRLYSYNGTWMVSTNGMITPNRGWGPRGCKNFLELFLDLQLDMSKLSPSFCYYVVMEHIEQINIVKHEKNNLTLTRVVNVETLEEVKKEDNSGGLATLQCNTVTFAEALLAHQTKCQPSPIKNDEVGYIIHLEDKRVFRLETWKYLHASTLKPNVIDPRYMWTVIAGLSSLDDTIEQAAERIIMHLWYFPWNTEFFTNMSELLIKLISTLYDDYNRIFTNGFQKTILNSRHVKFQHELARVFPKYLDMLSLEKFVLHQAPARLYYLINPDNI